MNLLATSTCMERLQWTLYAEAKDPRLQPNKDKKAPKTTSLRKKVKMPTPDAQSIVRIILADDRRPVAEVQRSQVEMISDVSFFQHLGRKMKNEVDPHRQTRATILKSYVGFDYRVARRLDGTPWDWLVMESKEEPEQKEIFERYMNKRKCCLRPFFCRRLRRKVSEFKHTQTPRFKKLVRFMADDGEALTSVRNELQHTRLNKVLMSKMQHGACSKMNRVRLQALNRYVSDDHLTLFPRAFVKKRKGAKKMLAEAMKSVRQHLQKRRRYRKHRDASLGTGRTPELQYINKRGKEVKADLAAQGNRMTRAEYDSKRKEWKDEFAALPECEKGACELAITHARERRRDRWRAERRAARLRKGLLPADEEEAFANDCVDDFATHPRSLWGIGCAAGPVSPESLTSHLSQAFPGEISMVKVADSIASREHTFVRDKDTGFNTKKCSAWRSKVRCCGERHPDLCLADARYFECIRMFNDFCRQFVPQLDAAELGQVLLRWRPVRLAADTGGTDSEGATHYTWWAWQLGNPRRHAFIVAEESEDPGVVTIIIEEGKFRLDYAHGFFKKLLSVWPSAWEVCSVKFVDINLRSVKVEDDVHVQARDYLTDLHSRGGWAGGRASRRAEWQEGGSNH